jgi:hypothetical protein
MNSQTCIWATVEQAGQGLRMPQVPRPTLDCRVRPRRRVRLHLAQMMLIDLFQNIIRPHTSTLYNVIHCPT